MSFMNKRKNNGSKTTSVNSCAVLRKADIRGWLLTLYVFCKLLKPMLSMLQMDFNLLLALFKVKCYFTKF